MVLVIFCILAAIAGIVVQDRENKRVQERINPPEPVPKDYLLKPEFNKEIKEIINDLQKKSERLEYLASIGFELYDSLPNAIKDCEKLQPLSDSNYYLEEAHENIESAIKNIKESML